MGRATLCSTGMPHPSLSLKPEGNPGTFKAPRADWRWGPPSSTTHLSPRPPGAGSSFFVPLGRELRAGEAEGTRGEREKKQAGKLGSAGVQRPQSIPKGNPRLQRAQRWRPGHPFSAASPAIYHQHLGSV